MSKMHIENKQLFKDLAVQIQAAHNLNPLAAKIFTYLLLDVENGGVTFDDITSFFKVSKSSVSTSIQLLLQMKLIEYTHKIDSRKRYFRQNRKNYMQSRLQTVLDFLEKEEDLSRRILNFVQTKDVPESNIRKINIYINHVEGAIEHIKETFSKLEKVKKDQ